MAPVRFRFPYPFLFRSIPFVALALSACGDSWNCKVSGDNIRGHIIYGGHVTRTPARRVTVQTSSDSFSANVTSAASFVNTQGLVVIPYDYCAPTETNLSFRAYEDTNSNNQWDSGEPTGRYDGTGNGNGTLIVHNLPKPNDKAVPPVEWKIQRDVNITLDTTGAQ